jgi:hypothetical protein
VLGHPRVPLGIAGQSVQCGALVPAGAAPSRPVERGGDGVLRGDLEIDGDATRRHVETLPRRTDKHRKTLRHTPALTGRTAIGSGAIAAGVGSRLQRGGHHDSHRLAEGCDLARVERQVDATEVGDDPQHIGIPLGAAASMRSTVPRATELHTNAAYATLGFALSAAYSALPVTLSRPSTRVSGPATTAVGRGRVIAAPPRSPTAGSIVCFINSTLNPFSDKGLAP